MRASSLAASNCIYRHAHAWRGRLVRVERRCCLHLAGDIDLTNVFDNLVAGALGTRVRMKMILFWMYASRAVAILIYLAAPKEPWTFYLFAAVLGATWLATVPPTAGLTGKLFGSRYLGTLFGLTLLSHQIGGFLGAWLGGSTVVNSGRYTWMWWADAALALAAAFVNLPIKETRPTARLATA